MDSLIKKIVEGTISNLLTEQKGQFHNWQKCPTQPPNNPYGNVNTGPVVLMDYANPTTSYPGPANQYNTQAVAAASTAYWNIFGAPNVGETIKIHTNLPSQGPMDWCWEYLGSTPTQINPQLVHDVNAGTQYIATHTDCNSCCCPSPPPPTNPSVCCDWCLNSGPPYIGTPPQGCEDWMCVDPQWISDYCPELGRRPDPIDPISSHSEDKMIDYVPDSETPIDKSLRERIRKIVEGTIDDMVFRDKPKKKHVKRMEKNLGPLSGFPIEKFKNVLPPKNESGETEEEIQKLDSILVDSDFVDSADDVDHYFEKFFDSKDLEYPREEIKNYMSGVRAIILQLKYHYNRPRPGQVADAKGMNFDRESLKSASTPSYPSGHAAQGRFIARLLSDMYPEYGKQLMKIGDDIAYSRNMAKVHYPSDSEFGKKLGDEMYDYISPDKGRVKEVKNKYGVELDEMFNSVYKIIIERQKI